MLYMNSDYYEESISSDVFQFIHLFVFSMSSLYIQSFDALSKKKKKSLKWQKKH